MSQMSGPGSERPGTEGWDEELGPMVSIPEPFWVRTWRTLYRSRPACYQCRITFPSHVSWEQHWLSEHYTSHEQPSERPDERPGEREPGP